MEEELLALPNNTSQFDRKSHVYLYDFPHTCSSLDVIKSISDLNNTRSLEHLRAHSEYCQQR